MNRLLIIFAIVLITFSFSDIQAQTWGNKLKDKMLNKLENKADQKIDKAADRVLKETVDDTEEAVKKNSKKDNKEQEKTTETELQQSSEELDYEDINELMEQYNNSSNSGNSKVTFEEPDLSNVQPSETIGKFTMIMESYNSKGKKKEKESGQITYHIDRYKIAMIIENFGTQQQGAPRMIVDRKNGTMTTLMNDNGTKQGIKMKMPKILVEGSEEESPMADFQITNETKVIDGKKCTKVIAEDEDSKSVMWVTKELNISMSEMLNYFQTGSKKKGSNNMDKLKSLEGFMMVEGEITDKSSGDVMKIKTKDVVAGQVDQSIFDESGYNVMDMSNGFGDMMNQMNNE